MAGDIEFSSMARMLNISIAIYEKSLDIYKKIAFYNSINNTEEVIR